MVPTKPRVIFDFGTNATQLVLQVQQQRLVALQTEKDIQLAECQQLREDLQKQLQYIYQTLTQLDDKEAHLEAQFQAIIHSVEANQAAVNIDHPGADVNMT